MKKVCIVAGARPNVIKVAPLARAIRNTEDICYQLVYTGSKNDPTIEESLFNDLQIPRPDIFLNVDCESLNELTIRVMGEFENYLTTNPADVVIVVDDLASTMAAAIVTKKRGIRLAHLVAGTRSFDITMPKEINRLVIDGLSDLLFTAGMSNNSIANREGAELKNVYFVGNILIDNLRYNRQRWQRAAILDELGTKEGEYIVFTLNRKALLANKEKLRAMLNAMTEAAGDMPIIAPLRDLASNTVKELCGKIHITDSLSYLEFGYLTANAKGIITDSGNVAEEATFNGVPCITLNSYTEHIETVKAGTNVLVGEDASKLGEAVKDMANGTWKKSHLPERWDGHAAERIISILL